MNHFSQIRCVYNLGCVIILEAIAKNLGAVEGETQAKEMKL